MFLNSENIEQDWKDALKEEFDKTYFQELMHFVYSEYKTKQCFPPQSQIFNAFEKCRFNDVKVVIIGQDPYPTPGHANGLAFSVNDGVKFPKSLQNIFKELEADLHIEIPFSGNLERWAEQGVLLLNSILTVEKGNAGSHKNKGWEKFTNAVIHEISNRKEHVVFMLWGNYAQKKGEKIDSARHLILNGGHPSPMSANRGHWFGNNHFRLANDYLQSKGLKPINW